MQSNGVNIRRFPLHAKHVDRKARLGTFGDWEVPLFYSSILEEHQAVRERAGLFDISHMGEFWVEGAGAEAYLDHLLPRKIKLMAIGKALYMPLLRDDGGILDDIIVYRFAKDQFLIIVNAANVDKDFLWFKEHVTGDVRLENQTDQLGLLALQGPKSEEILEAALGPESTMDLKYYHFKPFRSGMIARTGYTGEDGFEIMVRTEELEEIWNALFKTDLVPVGFGCRDTLRLEAGMLLYGHDMNETRNPFEAKIDWAISMDKSAFVGKESLAQLQSGGVKDQIIGFEMVDRGIPREGYEIKKGDQTLGKVTSGTMSPTLQKNIGLAYVPCAEAVAGSEIDIIIRERPARAKIINLPFYKRKK